MKVDNVRSPDLPCSAGSYEVSCSGRVILKRCEFNPSFLSRAKGLLGRKALGSEEGILLFPCNSIHMLFMKFAIDAVFLDSKGAVLHLCERLSPWCFSPIVWRSSAVLEMPAGTIATKSIKRYGKVTFERFG